MSNHGGSKMDTPQRVIIVGPNLPGSLQRQGQFHVHAEGCADLKRGAIRPYAEREVAVEMASQEDVAEYIYSDIIAESGGEAIDYLDEFHFAPCVHLPVNQER
jgi:hypothetical protein